jgi:hypothetical protein
MISDQPYDRHTYEIVLTNGKKLKFDYWEDAQVFWFQNCRIPDFLDFVLVVDRDLGRPKRSKGGGGGFG